jgi:hypothetical protein
VRGALAWIVTLIASCAPDYEHTAFRCDPLHGCPEGQTCQDGHCQRGAPTGDGVVCGTMTCTSALVCCVDLLSPPHCIFEIGVCSGILALCDGSEDCQPGDRCCADGDTLFCDASCDRYACRDAADCPSTAPNCCPDGTTPWGQCSPLGC